MVKLTDFEVLTFDCYGTLIDWEQGIWNALEPWLAGHGLSIDREQVLETFAVCEEAQEQETPGMAYTEVLANVLRRLAEHWGVSYSPAEQALLADSVKDWPAFADSAEALQYLHQHYRLVILSNVDQRSFRYSQQRLGVDFDAVCTAEEIGSYKPDLRSFEHLIRRVQELGFTKDTILHTAQSLFHDHVPATAIGLATNWINRRHDQQGWGATRPPTGEYRIDFEHTSMADLAAHHRRTLTGTYQDLR